MYINCRKWPIFTGMLGMKITIDAGNVFFLFVCFPVRVHSKKVIPTTFFFDIQKTFSRCLKKKKTLVVFSPQGTRKVIFCQANSQEISCFAIKISTWFAIFSASVQWKTDVSCFCCRIIAKLGARDCALYAFKLQLQLINQCNSKWHTKQEWLLSFAR